MRSNTKNHPFRIFFTFIACMSAVLTFKNSAYCLQLTPGEAANIVLSVGFPPPVVPIMTCIAYHESSFRPTILNYNTNDTIDYGFLQVNTIWLDTCHATPETILNVYTNAKCALMVYHDQGLTAWVTFNKFKAQCLNYKVKNFKLTANEKDYVVLKNTEIL